MPATPKLRQLVGMPVLVTGLLATMSLTTHDSKAIAHTSAPVVMKTAPVTTLKKKPIPMADRWVAPVSGYRLTARFGASSGLWSDNHTGLDFAAPSGTPIRSVTGGVVTEVGWDGAYGQKTVIRFKNGTELWYCHQNTVNVRVGQQVMPGDVIGSVGSTGNVTGPHLHLEVRPTPDTPVDPSTALAAHGVHV